MIDRDLLKQVILEQRAIPLPSDYIDRQLNARLQPLIQSDLILIITGVRQCGKSIVLKNIRLQRQEDYYINFDDDRLVNFVLEDFQILYEVFIELFEEQKTFYFDEIQNIEGWERFVRRLYEHGNKIFITGSNSTMLSQELGSRLTGRHIVVTLYPYSFYEFVLYQNNNLLAALDAPPAYTTQQTGKLLALFNEYMQIGGFPKYVKERLDEYLQIIFENILFKDIIVRYKLTKERELKQLAFFIASNVGKKVTFNAIRKMLNLGNATTVADYYQYFENCYLTFIVNIFSPSLKTQYANEKKQYFIDHGMTRIVGFRTSADEGRLLENIVFIELKRREYSIYVHDQQSECDFILHENNNVIAAIQVCKNLEAPQTREREYRGLLSAMHEHGLIAGLILTESTQAKEQITYMEQVYQINIMPIWKWLLEPWHV